MASHSVVYINSLHPGINFFIGKFSIRLLHSDIFEWGHGIFTLCHSKSTGSYPLTIFNTLNSYYFAYHLKLYSGFLHFSTHNTMCYTYTVCILTALQTNTQNLFVTYLHHAEVSSLRSPTLKISWPWPNLILQFLCQTIKSYTLKLVCQKLYII
jgi:hypothetical protein